MSTIDEKISKSLERVTQLKRQKKLQECQAKKKEEKIKLRRKIIIGEMVLQYFPEAEHFRPKSNADKNKEEFAFLDSVLSILASETQFITNLKERAEKYLNSHQE